MKLETYEKASELKMRIDELETAFDKIKSGDCRQELYLSYSEDWNVISLAIKKAISKLKKEFDNLN